MEEYTAIMRFAFTIIDDGNVRGILAPSGKLPQKLLLDMIDFLELSSPDSQKETTMRLQSKQWVSMEKVHAEARKAR